MDYHLEQEEDKNVEKSCCNLYIHGHKPICSLHPHGSDLFHFTSRFCIDVIISLMASLISSNFRQD